MEQEYVLTMNDPMTPADFGFDENMSWDEFEEFMDVMEREWLESDE